MAESARGDREDLRASRELKTMRQTSRITSLFVSLILSSASCADPTGLEFSAEAVEQLEPLPQYALWWQQVEACSGRRADFARVRWYRTLRGDPLEDGDGNRFDGYWWAQGNRIALQNINHGPTVRHEMLHAILQDGEHPLAMFADRCAGVVSFEEPEGYGASAAEIGDAVTVPAESALLVTVRADPTVPSASQYGGAFSIVVTATNRQARPVWINVPDQILGAAIYADLGWGGAVLTSAQRVLFLPNQARSVHVDWSEQHGGPVRVWGSFLGVRTNVVTVQVAP